MDGEQKQIAFIPYSEAVNALIRTGADVANNTAATAPSRNLSLGGYASPEAVKNAFGAQPAAPGIQTENFLYNAFTRIKDLFKGEYDTQYNIPENASFIERANMEWDSAEAADKANELAKKPYQAGVMASQTVGKRFDLGFMQSAFEAAKETRSVGPSTSFKVRRSSELADSGKGDAYAVATSLVAAADSSRVRSLYITLTGKEIDAVKALKKHWRYQKEGETVKVLLNGLPQMVITDVFAVAMAQATEWRISMLVKFAEFVKKFDRLLHVNDPRHFCCYLVDTTQTGVSDMITSCNAKLAGDSATSGFTLSPNSSATIQSVADAFTTYAKNHDSFTFLTGVQQWQ